MAAHNWRFGVSGGVARPKVSAILQVLYPARASVSRHPRQAAPTLAASRRTIRADRSGVRLKIKEKFRDSAKSNKILKTQ